MPYRYLLLVFLLLFVQRSSLADESRALGSVTLELANADDQVTREPLYTESHALLIGVSNYTGGWPELPGVRTDLDQVAELLAHHGFQIRSVLDPTGEELQTAYRSFIADHGRAEKARLLFYFAGHGYTRETSFGGKSGYIVPADAPLPQADWAAFRRKALNLNQIESIALDIDSCHALFVFDSCFSGTILSRAGASPPPAHISAKIARPTRQFLTAGAENQTVPDESIFRRQFCEGLKGSADLNGDGYVTAMELYSYLQENVTRYSNGSQTPLYGTIRDDRLDKGDFVFVLDRTENVVKVHATEHADLRISVLQPDTRTIELGNDVSMTLVWCPAGEFLMGGNKTEQFQVTLTKGFWMSESEVTVAQWEAIMGGRSWPMPEEDMPAMYLSWEEAMAFCLAASKKTGLFFQLPTEAQWEYACRAGSTSAYSFGDSESLLDYYAAYSGNTPHPLPVKSKRPNEWGLYDMHGNVWEWCLDAMGSYPEGPAIDFIQPYISSGDRVLRGGSFNSNPGHLLSGHREQNHHQYSSDDYGFRVCVSDR